MELVLTALALVAALVAAGAAVMVAARLKQGSQSTQSPDLVSRINVVIQQVQGGNEAQGARAVELQQVLDGRLSRLALQSSEESTRRLQADALARQELQAAVSERLVQMERKLAELEKSLNTGLDQLRTTNATELEKIRLEVAEKLQASLRQSLAENASKISELKDASAKHQDQLKESLRVELESVRTNNEAQLEKMRATVDEKLQGTLEKRLGQSFKLVSERLESVQRGLGEMQNLASDVGGLKKVLTNVKSRGTWGEVQLSRQLQDILAAEQYEENVAIKPGSGERVEFAVRLPGRQDESVVYLPIDSKFPQESYERLLESQETGDAADVAAATKELDRALRAQAKIISSKYIEPPLSTDFAIMYLPTEGLFAEAIRIPGLASALQRNERVMLTGPTTLMALLNSLQMGFRTLAIEKRSSEVWQVLAAAKDEFGKYGGVLDRLKKQLQTAQNTVDSAAVRTRAINRKLRNVESLEPATGPDGLDVALVSDRLEIEVDGDE